MKKNLLLLFFLLSLSFVYAQDESVFTHYHITPIIVNPAYAGFDGNQQINFNARAQWTSFPDAPKTLGVQYNGPLGKVFGIGVGVLQESAAKMSRLRARLNYGFRFPIGASKGPNRNVNMIGLGFSTEFEQMSLGNNTLAQNFYELGDNIIEAAVDGENNFDASVGAFGRFYFKDENMLYAGLAFTNLVQSRLNDVVTTANETSILSHYVFLAGYKMYTNTLDGFYIEPSIMLRQVMDGPFQADFNIKAGFRDDLLVAGLAYRNIGAVGILLGTDFGNSSNAANSGLRFFYSFDLSTQEFQKFTSGSHEVTLAFGFGNNKNGTNN